MLAYTQTDTYTDSSAQGQEYEIALTEVPSFDPSFDNETNGNESSNLDHYHCQNATHHTIHEHKFGEFDTVSASSFDSSVGSMGQPQRVLKAITNKEQISHIHAIQEGIMTHQLIHAITQTQTKHHPVQRKSRGTGGGNHNMLMDTARSVDDTASLSVMTCDDVSLLSAEIQEQAPTTKHSNTSRLTRVGNEFKFINATCCSFSSIHIDTRPVATSASASYVSAKEGEHRYDHLHTYGKAQQKVKRDLQLINRIKSSQKEIVFKLRLQDKKKRMKSKAPPLPPLEERGRRIHDTYASKKNEAGRKLREQIERTNVRKAMKRQVNWK